MTIAQQIGALHRNIEGGDVENGGVSHEGAIFVCSWLPLKASGERKIKFDDAQSKCTLFGRQVHAPFSGICQEKIDLFQYFSRV